MTIWMKGYFIIYSSMLAGMPAGRPGSLIIYVFFLVYPATIVHVRQSDRAAGCLAYIPFFFHFYLFIICLLECRPGGRVV